MCSCPFVYWYRQTPSKERGLGEHISRLKICYLDIAYTIKRKHKCSSSFSKFADFIDKDSNNAFLAYCLHFTLVSDCKITNKIPIHKKNFATARKKFRSGNFFLGQILKLHVFYRKPVIFCRDFFSYCFFIRNRLFGTIGFECRNCPSGTPHPR